MPTKKKQSFVFRDAKTGKIVTEKFAHANQATTVKEKIKRYKIKTVADIDTVGCPEGILLLAALAVISTTTETKKTPDQIITQLQKLVKKMKK